MKSIRNLRLKISCVPHCIRNYLWTKAVTFKPHSTCSAQRNVELFSFRHPERLKWKLHNTTNMHDSHVEITTLKFTCRQLTSFLCSTAANDSYCTVSHWPLSTKNLHANYHKPNKSYVIIHSVLAPFYFWKSWWSKLNKRVNDLLEPIQLLCLHP